MNTFLMIRAVFTVQLQAMLVVAWGLSQVGMAWAEPAGTLDSGFTLAEDGGSSGHAYALARQPDGKILVGGEFSSIHGGVNQRGIARLDADGTLDNTFTAAVGVGQRVNRLAIQADGKIVIAGVFTSVNDVTRNSVARLNADGTLDTGFDPGLGAYNPIEAMLLLPDGKILIGGALASFDGRQRTEIARLNPDGSLDTTFITVGMSINDRIYDMALQADGKILVAGTFTQVDGVSRNRIARLNTDGSLDVTFAPGTGADNAVYAIALQDNGDVLIAGDFMTFNGSARHRIARLNTDGSLDAGFDPGVSADSVITAMAIQPDGGIFIGGNFNTVAGVVREGLARLNNDGTLDAVADPAPIESFTSALLLQADGKLLAAGAMNNIDPAHDYLVWRLHTGDSDSDLVQDGSDYFGNNAAASTDADADGLADAWLQPNPYGCLANASVCNGLSLDDFIDTDRDGIFSLDNCSFVYNPNQSDNDTDGSGDACDHDNDNDALANWLDNCPLHSNVSQDDLDGDSVGDDCDANPVVAPAGIVDDHYQIGSGANNNVDTIAVQTDGKAIIGGQFTLFDGVAGSRIARVNLDGSIDVSFNAGTGASGNVRATAQQADGKLLIAGSFTSYNGSARNRIARLNIDGSLDATFANVGSSTVIRAMALQPDGKVLIAGDSMIKRLNADGTLDNSFSSGTGVYGNIFALAVQSNGKILIGGSFTGYNEVIRNRIARLNADGSLDGAFNPSVSTNAVNVLVLQPDGRILVGGSFTTVSGYTRRGLARLQSGGSVDSGFNAGNVLDTGAGISVSTIARQPDGKIFIGGNFTQVSGVSRNGIARLQSNGALDTTFDPGTGMFSDNSVSALAIQPDGKLLAGGSFKAYHQSLVSRLARIHTGNLDADGVQDGADVFPLDASESVDTDKDGIGNNADTDDDGDGMPDVWETTYGLNPLLDDAAGDLDGDGISNLDEYTGNTDPSVPDVTDVTQNDFNNDGTADVLLRSTSGGNWQFFSMVDGVAASSNVYGAYSNTAWQLMASEDFDADGDTDVLLRNTTSGAWRMFITQNGMYLSDSNFAAYSSTDWVVASVADYNGDGTKDLLLHNTVGGSWRVFYISNGAVSGNASMNLFMVGWDLKYDGDIDGDGDADIILRRASDGYWRQFTVEGGVVASNSATSLYQSLDWQLQFVSDLDNDGDDDIVLRNVVSGYNWRTFSVSAGTVSSNSKLSLYENANWSFDHLNDVDLDGDDDIVLRSNTGGWRLFLTDSLDTPANTAIGLYANSQWVTADVVDANGDGTKDVILNNTSSGAWHAFMIETAAVASDTNPGLYQNVDWTLQNK